VVDAGAAAAGGDSLGARVGLRAPLPVPDEVGIGVGLACAATGAPACARIVGGAAATADEQHVGAQQPRGPAASARAGDRRVRVRRRAARPVAVAAPTAGPGRQSVADRIDSPGPPTTMVWTAPEPTATVASA